MFFPNTILFTWINLNIAVRAGNDDLASAHNSRFVETHRGMLILAAIMVCFIFLPSPSWAAEVMMQDEIVNGQDEVAVLADCGQLASRQKELLKELRGIKKEIALLRMRQEKPGSREIFAGIGYILGLLGVAAFFASRRKVI